MRHITKTPTSIPFVTRKLPYPERKHLGKVLEQDVIHPVA